MERYVYRLIGRDLELLGESLDLAGIEAAGKEVRQRFGACAKWNVSGQEAGAVKAAWAFTAWALMTAWIEQDGPLPEIGDRDGHTVNLRILGCRLSLRNVMPLREYVYRLAAKRVNDRYKEWYRAGCGEELALRYLTMENALQQMLVIPEERG